MSSGRYDTTALMEDQYEPGSRGRVLKNPLAIKSKRKMSERETRELLNVTHLLIETIGADHRFTAHDLCRIHRLWLGSIYEWAGRYRQVLVTKGGFPFASPRFIPKLMEDFERDLLARYTPCLFPSASEVTEALAIVHTELLLIHPFREGNGWLARLLATLMALQARLPLLDYGIIRGEKREEYYLAVRCGLDRNYEPMKRIFSEVISRTLKTYQSRRIQ